MSAVTIQPRDVTFTFTDSCNCCLSCLCCKNSYAKDDDVYVNSNGELEPFNKSKAKKDVEQAFERAKTHLLEGLNARLALVEGNPEEFKSRATKILESIDSLKKVNVAHIDGINELMLEYLKSKTLEVKSELEFS